MRGRGVRGRGSWRTNVQSTTPDTPEAEAFPAPKAETQPPPKMEFYQEDVPVPTIDEVAPEQEFDTQVAASVSDSDVSMQEGEAEPRKRAWEKKSGGVKIKRKKVPGLKNLKIRRYVQPKNAVMCLNELRSGVSYTTEQEGGVGTPYCVSVEVPGSVDGQKYRGFGSSKQLAKQAAAEAALISFVKPPVATAVDSQEDKTPWATLASFAIYKLFNDWREGRVGMCPPPQAQSYGSAVPPGIVQAFLNQTMGTPAVKEETTTPQATMFTENICAHLGGRQPNPQTTDGKTGEVPVKVPNPAKAVPENAATMHPVMVLHQMKPGLHYNISQDMKDNKPFFSVTAEIEGKEFTGEGPNVKKAKFFLAKEAIMGIYAIESQFESQAN